MNFWLSLIYIYSNIANLEHFSLFYVKDTVTFYIIISRIIFFLTVILYDMISKTFRNPE